MTDEAVCQWDSAKYEIRGHEFDTYPVVWMTNHIY